MAGYMQEAIAYTRPFLVVRFSLFVFRYSISNTHHSG